MGFGANSRKGKLYLDSKSKITVITIKANIRMPVEHLQWVALHYYQAPEVTWDDVDPSEIQTFQ